MEGTTTLLGTVQSELVAEFTEVGTSMTDTIVDILPIGLAVFGVLLVIRLGKRFFASIAN